jgi:hypothetical protein
MHRSPASIDRSSHHRPAPPRTGAAWHAGSITSQPCRAVGRQAERSACRPGRGLTDPPHTLPALLRTCPKGFPLPMHPWRGVHVHVQGVVGVGGGWRGWAGVGARREAVSTLPEPYLPHRAGKPSPARLHFRDRQIWNADPRPHAIHDAMNSEGLSNHHVAGTTGFMSYPVGKF